MFLSRVIQSHRSILSTLISIRKHNNYASAGKHNNYASARKHNNYASARKHNYYDSMWKHNIYASIILLCEIIQNLLCHMH